MEQLFWKKKCEVKKMMKLINVFKNKNNNNKYF